MYELRSELDQALVLISHSLAQKIKIIDSSSTFSIRLKTDDLFMADKIARDAFYTIEDNLISYNFFTILFFNEQVAIRGGLIISGAVLYQDDVSPLKYYFLNSWTLLTIASILLCLNWIYRSSLSIYLPIL